MTKTIRCDRCNRRYRNQNDWNVTVKNGYIVGHLCPDCQTPEEYTEAAINEATTDYGMLAETGQMIGWNK